MNVQFNSSAKMWFHHVTALKNSVSVNAWTGCNDESVVEKIYQQINSFNSNKKKNRLKQLRAFIRNSTNVTNNEDLYSNLDRDSVRLMFRLSALFASLRKSTLNGRDPNLFSLSDPEELLSVLYSERFEELVHRRELPVQVDWTPLCGSHIVDSSGATGPRVVCPTSINSTNDQRFAFEQAIVGAQSALSYRRHIKIVSTLMDQLEASTRATWILNIVEHEVGTIMGVGRMTRVISDIRCCFSSHL